MWITFELLNINKVEHIDHFSSWLSLQIGVRDLLPCPAVHTQPAFEYSQNASVSFEENPLKQLKTKLAVVPRKDRYESSV